MTFLAPLLAGIVVGLASMITIILNKLQTMLGAGTDSEVAGFGVGDILEIFDLTSMIPPYFLQISIGIYLIQIVFILTGTLVTVDSGTDKLKTTFDRGKFLKFSILLYLIVAFIAIVMLAFLAEVSLKGLSG